MRFVRTDQKVLILSDEPMAAALVGALVEQARLRPAFANDGESAAAALARVKPMLAILIDALSDTSHSDLFLARARTRSVSVALFCGETQKARRLEWARSHGISVFGLPADIEALHTWLTNLAAPTAKARSRRRGQRRGQPIATKGTDGTLILLDAQGVRWSVYDRRSSDRRSGDATQRHFISDSGEERACDLASHEESDTSAIALSEQLARSRAVPEL